MKRNKKILVSILLILIVSLAIGCSNDAEEDTEVYDETQKNSNYFIESHLFDHDIRFYTAFSINRDEDEEQALSPEDRLERSLLNNDPSEQDILSSYTDLSLEWPNLYIHFNEEGDLSTTTAQSTLFFDSLFGISDLYGVEEIIFLNPDGEKNITVAERLVDDSIVIKDERGFTRGYYTIYDEELDATLFLPGGELEEQIVDENDDPLSFPETVEAMGTIDHEDAIYSSAIVEGIEIVDASITKGVASVQYTMDEDKVTEEDRTVFENAIQFAALDFHAWEVELMNDTLKESNTYPLVEDIEKEDEQADDDDKEDIEKDDEDKDESKLTEDEAKEKLIDYMKENKEEYIDGYDIIMEEENNSFQADIFPSIPKDEGRGPSRVASYKINRKTGDIERVDDWGDDKTEPYISEIVDFSEEERRTHHEKLAGGPEHIQEKVYEHLMLPGIHENTKKYEGRINPGERIRFRFPDAEKFVDRSTDDPSVSKDGYFTVNLNAFEFKAGQDILVSITKGYPQEQTFTLTVKETQEGMEEIRVR